MVNSVIQTKKLTDAIKCHKVTERDLKYRLRAAESLSAKAQSQPKSQPSTRSEKVAENLAFKAQIQPPAKPNEYIAHFELTRPGY